MIVEIYYPGTPGIPGIPAKYVEINGPSWSSGAVSIPVVQADGGYKWKIPASVVGVFIGLARNYPGAGYFGIDHALYFSRGTVEVYERGQRIVALGGYVSGDEWTMFRQAGRVWMLKNGVKELDRPSLIDGTFRLAATEYLSDDKVVDAAVADALPASGTGSAVLEPLVAMGFDTAPANWGTASIGPLAASGGANGHASGAAVLSGLLALGFQRPMGQGAATLAPLTSYAESDLLAPSFATGSALMGPAAASGSMASGGIGAGLVSTRIMALGSDRSIAQGGATLQPMFAFGAEAMELRGSVLTIKGGYRVVASARGADVTAARLLGPMLTMEASTGAQAKIKLPMIHLEASGTVPSLASLGAILPRMKLNASGTVTHLAAADLTLEGGYGVTANTGAQARLATKSGYDVSGNGITTERAHANLSGPGFFVVEAGASRDATASAALVGPALVAAPTGSAWLVGPALRLYAEAGEVVAATYESYAINLATGAVTRYTNYPFDNILRFGNGFFGVRADGVYALTGETDNGADIEATIKTFQTDFKSANRKRVPWIYLLGRADVGLQVTVEADEGTPYSYPATQTSLGGARAVRATAGKGIRGTYYAFTIQNTAGSGFEIDRVEAVVDVTTRAI